VAAAAKGELLEVEKLLAGGATADCVGYYNSTTWNPLQAACHHGKPAVVRALLASKSCPALDDRYDTQQLTALHAAAQKLRCECVLALVERNADTAARDENGNTPLHRLAMFSAFADADSDDEVVAMAEALLGGKGASVDAVTAKGQTALWLAADAKHERLVSLLLDRGADVTVEADGGVMPAHVIRANMPSLVMLKYPYIATA
jgi:ankyrin repeat protein